jgi:putative phosphonate metabolism protein
MSGNSNGNGIGNGIGNNGIGGFRRYALYWTPEPGPLAAFGAAWLGWDAETGQAVPHPPVAGLPGPLAALTEAPRRYGLHATIKPPFRLAAGTAAADLDAAAAALCARLAPVEVAGLVLTALGPWLALTPEGDATALGALAAAVVAGLDAFRAPPDAAEIARRNPPALSDRQRALLDRWGYPYVMEEFAFHITLAGPLPPEAQAPLAAAARPCFAPLLPRPFRIDRLALCGEGADGRFRLLRRYPLTG